MQTLSLLLRKRAFVFLFLFAASFTPAWSQLNNSEAYTKMVLDFLKIQQPVYGQYTGFVPADLASRLSVVPKSPVVLKLDDPEVDYRLIKGKGVERLISTRMVLKDSAEKEFFLAWSDTVPKREVTRLRRKVPGPLRGEDPLWVRKFLIPGLSVGAGIAAIIALFYVRS